VHYKISNALEGICIM